MTQPESNPRRSFADLYHSTAHRQSLCILAVLTWVASCNGRIEPREQALLEKIAEAVDDVEEFGAVESAAKLQRVEELALACRYLRTNLDPGGKRLLAQLAITVAIADGSFSVGENHLLQFLADLLDLRPRALARLFQQVARRPLPRAGDPSSLTWWRQREAGTQAPPETSEILEQFDDGDPEPAPAPMNRHVALTVLGLDESASADTIHKAYRHLAKVRHPDRFAPLGAAAVMTADALFKRLHEAYAVLI